MQIFNENNKQFTVKLIDVGDSYGRDNCLTNDDALMVEFYDTEHDQFVSRYYADTLLGNDEFSVNGGVYPNGLCLQGDVPEWNLSADNMLQVIGYLHGYNAR